MRWRDFFLVVLLVAFIAFIIFLISKTIIYPETKLLPWYICRTLFRLIVTYIIALIFGLVFGIILGMNEKIGNFGIPILDILQSIPVLGFFPIALIAVIALFHQNIIGLELASMFLLFTSMAWAIIFGVIAGVKSIPPELKEMAKIFKFSRWKYIKNVILPSIYPSLIANSILAFGGGWYFIVATEYIDFGNKIYALPGIGYYLNISSFKYGSIWMSLLGFVIIAVIVGLMNRLIWHKLSENAKDYRFLALNYGVEENEKKSRLTKFIEREKSYMMHILHVFRRHKYHHHKFSKHKPHFKYYFAGFMIIAFILFLVFSLFQISFLNVRFIDLFWFSIFSLTRLSIAYVLSLIFVLIVAFIIIKHNKSKNFFMPIFDILQSIPAVAYFPLMFLFFINTFPVHIGIEIASIFLIMTGMTWYLMFNVIEAVDNMPYELKEVSDIFGIKGKIFLSHFLIPALLPAIVTGSILAFGGGWNASIVSEYVNVNNNVYIAPGLGSALHVASGEGNMAMMAAVLIVMAFVILIINNFIWRKLLNKLSNYIIEE